MWEIYCASSYVGHGITTLIKLIVLLQLDLNPLAWSLSGQAAPDDPIGDSLSLQQALDQILIFSNAHLSLRHENQVAVFAAGLGKR